LKHDALARQIAERIQTPVTNSLDSEASQMGMAELRGYVRARALRYILERVQPLAIEHNLPQSDVNELISAAIERTVHLVVNQFAVQPIVPMPAPHVRLRAA
jgi:hypothetical protein